MTLAGGTGLSIAALLAGRKDVALGTAAGAILAAVGFLGLKSTLRRALAEPNKNPKRLIFASNWTRWFLWAVVMFLLLKVSVFSLLGALASYLVFLGILAFFGLRMGAASMTDESPLTQSRPQVAPSSPGGPRGLSSRR
jgi:hypothetical protein